MHMSILSGRKLKNPYNNFNTFLLLKIFIDLL